jgi:cobalt/nickel transport system permease protein
VAILSLFQPGGWQAFVLIVSRCTLCFITAILLGATTPVTELVQVLRKVRVPSLLITTMLLMHRYLFVLLDESQRMRRARASRTFVKRRHLEWRTMASIIGQLFIRSVERAERVYAAMSARGWQ